MWVSYNRCFRRSRLRDIRQRSSGGMDIGLASTVASGRVQSHPDPSCPALLSVAEVARTLLTQVTLCSLHSPEGACPQLICCVGTPGAMFLPPTETQHPAFCSAPGESVPGRLISVLLPHLCASTKLAHLNTRHLQPEKRPAYLYF